MGLRHFLKSLVDPAANIESTVATQEAVVRHYRDKFPERDLNAWLALALHDRPEWKTKEVEQSDLLPCFIATAAFSLAGVERGPIVLGLFLSEKQFREKGIAFPEKFDRVFNHIMASIYSLDPETRAAEWRRANPWTAEHHPDLAEALRQWSPDA